MTKKVKPKKGRPTKYKSEYNTQVFKLCLLGATDKEIAEFFNVVESTVNLWKKESPEFSESIKKGKLQADAVVAHSLYKRAKGFTYEEKTFEQTMITTVSESGAMQQQPGTLVKIVKKLIVPDTTAQIFFLKNRRKEDWRDKQVIEQEGAPTQIIWNETKTYLKK